MSNEGNCTLYVGNLDHTVTEDLITMLFSQLGEIRSCKMFREPSTDPYCFVEFGDHVTAVNAIAMMNDKLLQTRKMRVDWATGQGNKNKYNKIDTSRHHHVYVGDLSPEIDEQALQEAFQVFGEISDCKVVRDPQSFKSRGYGFVVFVKKMDAETSISAMNNQWLGRKMIKTRWATRKPANTPMEEKPVQKKLNWDDVFNQTTATNTTVFCGGLKQDVSEDVLHKSFQPFGGIEKIKIFKEKGYAFIKYSIKDHACKAIVEMHNTNLNGQVIRCSWGKDTGEGPNPALESNGTVQAPVAMATNGAQVGQMGYYQYGYYPQQMPYGAVGGYNQYAYAGYPQPGSGYMWMGGSGWQQGWVGQQPQQPPQ